MEFIERIFGMIFVLCGAVIIVDQVKLYKLPIPYDTAMIGALLILTIESFTLVKNIVFEKNFLGVPLNIILMAAAFVFFLKGVIPLPLWIWNYLGVLYGVLLILFNFGKAM